MAGYGDKVEKVRAFNNGSTKNNVEFCKKLDYKMIYLSTGYVFNACSIAFEVGLYRLQAIECLWSHKA